MTSESFAGFGGSSSNIALTNALGQAVNLTFIGTAPTIRALCPGPATGLTRRPSGAGGVTISSVANLNFSNGGTATFSGANSFTGPLTVIPTTWQPISVGLIG